MEKGDLIVGRVMMNPEEEVKVYSQAYGDAINNTIKIIDECSVGKNIDTSITNNAEFIKNKILETLGGFKKDVPLVESEQ